MSIILRVELQACFTCLNFERDLDESWSLVMEGSESIEVRLTDLKVFLELGCLL